MSNAPTFSLSPGEVQLWDASLAISPEEESKFLTLLSPDEIQRALRFRFPQHKRRFIAARGILRSLLGRYLNTAPQAITFLYTEHGKPYLQNTPLQFNVSHSHEMAVFAFTKACDIGVDIEKIENDFKEGVAQRYFSIEEYEQLMLLPEELRAFAFYRIWALKEALIKAIGEGLHFSLASFSVSLSDPIFEVTLEGDPPATWYFQTFAVHPEYQAAFATSQAVENVSHWQWL